LKHLTTKILTVVIDDPLADYTPEELETKVAEANELFEDGGLLHLPMRFGFNLNPVKNTGEATLDSSFLVRTVNINIQKARGLKFGTGAFSIEDFVTRLVGFMGGYKPPEEVSSEASDVEEDDAPLDWGKVGRRAMAKSRRVPAMGFM
jgi:hypothetical protein